MSGWAGRGRRRRTRVKPPLKTKNKIAASLGGAVLLVTLVAVTSFWAFQQIKREADARTESFVLLNRANDLLAAMLNAETGQRGFSLTGREILLEPYLSARDQVPGRVDDLRRLSLNHPAHRHAENMAPLIATKMTELAQMIELRRGQNMTAVIALVGGDQGKRTMDAIRLEIKAFTQLEQTELAEHEAQFQLDLRRLFAVIVAASACAVVLALLFAYVIYRETQHELKNRVHVETQRLLDLQRETNQQLRRAEEELRQLNAQLEQRVAERTFQLEAANRELEAFSYSVSHDLRSPVRAIDGFSQAVLEDFGPLLPEEGRDNLGIIRRAAQQMGVLIDDLLAFAQLNQQEVNKRPIDTGKGVRAILDELGFPWPKRAVALQVGDLPACSGDPALLKQVWVNLLSNALKYTRKRERAAIEIGCTQVHGADAFFVRDNGTGFDMNHADKLFGVFQRFHRAEDYEGTGVGLAIVQRIVNRHGGRVWADAAVDRGATFYFTLEKETKL